MSAKKNIAPIKGEICGATAPTIRARERLSGFARKNGHEGLCTPPNHPECQILRLLRLSPMQCRPRERQSAVHVSCALAGRMPEASRVNFYGRCQTDQAGSKEGARFLRYQHRYYQCEQERFQRPAIQSKNAEENSDGAHNNRHPIKVSRSEQTTTAEAKPHPAGIGLDKHAKG